MFPSCLKECLFFHGRQNQAGLQDLPEFEKYCYVVAGVVGELLTTIFSNHSPLFKERIAGHEDLAIAFGQALQMDQHTEGFARGQGSWCLLEASKQQSSGPLKTSVSKITRLPKLHSFDTQTRKWYQEVLFFSFY